MTVITCLIRTFARVVANNVFGHNLEVGPFSENLFQVLLDYNNQGGTYFEFFFLNIAAISKSLYLEPNPVHKILPDSLFWIKP